MSAPTGTNTTLQIATNTTFTDVVYSGSSTAYRINETFGEDDLPYGRTLFARVKHTSSLGETDWSNTTSFKILSPTDIIGVCYDTTTLPAQWHWIDSAGNKLNTFNYQAYPTFANAKMVTYDTSRAPVTMTAIPKFYIKTAASGPAGTFSSGKKCWFITPNARAGFRPHPAFKRNPDGTISDWCYLGTYLGHEETVGELTTIGSKADQVVKGNITIDNARTYITNRNLGTESRTIDPNDNGESGYRMFDCWDLGLLKLLSIIAKCSSNTQTAWGRGSSSAEPRTGRTKARIVFKGTQDAPTVWVDDLWECYYYFVDCQSTSKMTYALTSPMDLTSPVEYGTEDDVRYTGTKYSGWITDVLDCPMTIGDDTHDLMELFLPKTVISTESQSAYGDYAYVYTGSSQMWCAGYYWNTNNYAGLFTSNCNFAATATNTIGCRIAKN